MQVWEEWPHLVEVVREAHNKYLEAGATGHNFDHAFQVAVVAAAIVPDEHVARLASAAGLCHNADHFLVARPHNSKLDINELVTRWLSHVHDRLTTDECMQIVNAVVEHSKPNNPDDSPVTVALKDADRVVCLGLDVVVRCAQHQGATPIDPWLLLGDQRGQYNQRLSMPAVLSDCLDWVSDDPRFRIRLPKARAMAEERAKAIRWYLDTLAAQRDEIGLVPYPLSR